MRISEAIEFLREPLRSNTWDQQNLLIDNIEFPDDKRLRFYSSDSERHFFNVIFTGPYKGALAAISNEDDLLALCRDEIEKFHDLYVNISPAKMLDDQRKARIPLVNIFRYYALWLCIAESQKLPILSRDRVMRDFQARVDVAFECYVKLLEWMCMHLNDLAKSDDSEKYVSHLVLLQRVVDIPLTVLNEDQAHKVIKNLDATRLAEEGMNNRMVRAKREAIGRFHQVLGSCSGSSELIRDDLPIRWSVCENFQTSDRSLDHQFSLLSRRAMTLSNIRANIQEPAWHFPELPSMESALNSCEINQFIFGLQSVQDTDFISLYEYLCKSILFSGDARDALVAIITESRRRLSEPPYVGNSVHCATLTHTLLVHFYAFLATDDSSKVVNCFQAMMRQLDRILREQPRFNLESVKLVGFRAKHTWRNWRCPWGFAYHFWRLTNGEVGRGGVTDGSIVLRTNFGDRGEQLASLLSSQELARLFSTLANELGGLAGSDWIKREFERVGLVVTEDNCRILGDGPAIQIRAFSSKWMKAYNDKYLRLRSDEVKWSDAEVVIRETAREICMDVRSGKKRNVVEELKERFGHGIQRALTARYVIVGLCGVEDNWEKWALLLGWANREAAFHYAQDHGFSVSKLGAIWPDSPLLPHETSGWLSTTAPPQHD